MQTKKLSFARIIAMALCAIVFAAAFTIPLVTQQKSAESVSAAAPAIDGLEDAKITVNFSGFPTNIKPYVVITWTHGLENGLFETSSQVLIPDANNTASVTIHGEGKLEINYPLYSTITALASSNFISTQSSIGATASSFVTYDVVTRSTETITATVTFNDNGWFAGTTIY